MSKPFYITTTLPYVTAEPHIGFATEIIRADIIARWRKSLGEEVFFNTGADEHGQNIYQKALAAGQEPQVYVDKWAKKFRDLIKPLGISGEINFVRTTNPEHISAAQEFWRRCAKAGFIYKKNYQIKYCVGCELEKTESELVGGKCPLHPIHKIELRDEENYFFKFSEFQDKLLKLYEVSPDFVLSAERFNEIKKFVERGLQDFSISRLANKMPWGVPVPNDPDQVMYVWFDALVNYISVIGWPDDKVKFKKWWLDSGGVVQYCGKDNLRQQAAMWQAMLMSVGLSPSKRIIIDGFITSGGQKMSKSLGNVVNPFEVIEKYDTDALRYFVAREFSTFEDSDFSWERFKEAYNANLANGLGNLVNRVLKMSSINNITAKPILINEKGDKLIEKYNKGMENYDLNMATNAIWEMIAWSDKSIQSNEPFKKIKSENQTEVQEAKEHISLMLNDLLVISKLLTPIMPETAKTIENLVKENKMPEKPLFLRQD